MSDSVTLKEHFEALLVEKDKALSAALVAVKEEGRKTEVAAEKRFDLLNELRQGVATKEQLEALDKIVGDLANRMNRFEGGTKGSARTLDYILMALVAASIVVGLMK